MGVSVRSRQRTCRGAETALTEALQAELEWLAPEERFRVAEVTLPWSRSFEVDIVFDIERS